MLDEDFQGAFLSNEPAISYFNINNFRSGRMILPSEVIFLVPFSMYFRKHSCLVASANRQINDYTSSGLLLNWVHKYVDEKFLSIKKMGLKKIVEHRPLELDQLRGSLMLIFLVDRACLLFIMEIMSPQYMLLKNILNFLHLNK